jgi:putative MATE family efflux protein
LTATSVPETDAHEELLLHPPPGKFTQGPILQHVLVMSAAGSIGLMAVFAVDFLNLLYISWLKDQTLTAAVGYASVIGFFLISICIGFMIAVSALVSRALGARERRKAQEIAGVGLLYIFSVTLVLAIVIALLGGPLLNLLGAQGETFFLAYRFLMMTLPSMLPLGFAMVQMGILRAVGDARRAMWVTLGGGLFTAAMDPLFIFIFKLGLDGAAIVMTLARLLLLGIGSYGVFFVHKLAARPTRASFLEHFGPLNAIAIPAVVTNIATPVANGYVTFAMAQFGDAAVAAWAIINRLIPLAFGATFALSGAIGPILGQNFGARLFGRLRTAMRDSILIVGVYILAVWLLLYAGQNQLAYVFSLSDEAADLLRYYCTIVAGTFFFMGMLFTANAAFNNLGFPLLSTFFNWSRATLGTIPFVYLLGKYYGAKGVLLGQGVGAMLFGVAAIFTSFYAIRRLEKRVI